MATSTLKASKSVLSFVLPWSKGLSKLLRDASSVWYGDSNSNCFTRPAIHVWCKNLEVSSILRFEKVLLRTKFMKRPGRRVVLTPKAKMLILLLTCWLDRWDWEMLKWIPAWKKCWRINVTVSRLKRLFAELVHFYRAMHFIANARYWDRMSSVRLSVCPSVTLVDCDHIGWKSWKLITRTTSPTPSLCVAKRRSA